MGTVRIKIHLSSDTLTVKSAKLAPLVGKDVEVIVQEQPHKNGTSARGFMRGTVLRYDDPFGPAVPPDDWEALQ